MRKATQVWTIGEGKQKSLYRGLPGPNVSHEDEDWYPFLKMSLNYNKGKVLLAPNRCTAFTNLLKMNSRK